MCERYGIPMVFCIISSCRSAGETISFIIVSLLMSIAICRRSVELRGPRSFCTASLFIPTSKHLRKRHALHWFRCVLSTIQSPSDLDLHTQFRSRRIDRLKKPAQPSQAKMPQCFPELWSRHTLHGTSYKMRPEKRQKNNG